LRKTDEGGGALPRALRRARRHPLSNEARARSKPSARAHAREGPPPSSTQVTSVVKQQKERARWLPHRKQARSEQLSTRFFRDLGAGGRPRGINSDSGDDPVASGLRV